MKDRLEFRFTIATGKIEAKALKPIAKIVEAKAERIAEAVTKVIEVVAENHTKEVKDND